jgi:hypothetical protein
LYNNYPLMPEKYFDPNISPEDVKEKITEGVESLQYFEFEYHHTYVNKVTYDDGTSTSDPKKDPIIGKEIKLKGLLVDVSPHLIRSRLFAGEIRVVDFVLAKLSLAVQSDLFRTVRDGISGGERVLSADFESTLYESHILENEYVKEENSRYLREIEGSTNLKIHYNVNSFYFPSLEGKVYGYLGPSLPTEKNGIRKQGRRLLISPSIPQELKQDFRINDNDLDPVSNIIRNDLEGSYELIEEKRLGVLRYLNFIPFADDLHNPPKDYKFSIAIIQERKKILPSPQIIIELDDEKCISRDGGICVFSIPENIKELDKLQMEIRVKKTGSKNDHIFLIEPKYDFILNDNQKFVILGSGEKRKEIKIRVYESNRLVKDSNIKLTLETVKNDKSPTVASWSESSTSTKNGIATCFIDSIDLEDCKDGIEDPVLTKLSGGSRPIKISGELPWDRHYGNYLSLTIQSNERPVIKMNIPVRVLHQVKSYYLENVYKLDKETIQDIVTKILSYYTRNYPWLHAEYRYVRDKANGRIKPVYNQFLRIKEYLDFTDSSHVHDWHSVQESVSKIDHFLDRLERDDNDWRKMPRSRDFPKNGTEFFKAWKTSLINKLIQDINESKAKLLKGSNNDTTIESAVNINNWQEVETIINDLDSLIGLASLAPEHRKTLLTSKMTLYDFMLEKLSMTKVQKGHSHSH